MTTPSEIANQLLSLVEAVLSDLESEHAPGLDLPRVHGGYLVGPDARADLAFTLSLLHEAGVEQVAGLQCADIALDIVRQLDGTKTHSFYSYRTAETLLRFGGLDDNPALKAWNEADLANAAEAIDSSSMLEALAAGQLPNNYAVVLTRCEFDRFRLGRLPDEGVLDTLIDKVSALFTQLPTSWLDDFGGANFDIYTPDVYLFAEPFAERLGSAWSTGFQKVLSDVADLATPQGAIVWGRSTGALGVVMNIELGATALSRALTDDPEGWLGKAELATRQIGGWFEDGLVNAHKHRSTMFYRGPQRRLQMTFDLLGKLVQASLELQKADPVDAATPAASFQAVDRLIVLDPRSNASVWTHRGRGVDFVLPFVGGFWVDYTSALRWPGTYEVPVNNNQLAAMLPVVHADGIVRTTFGTPDSIQHTDGQLDVSFKQFTPLDSALTVPEDPDSPDTHASETGPIAGFRYARYRVDRRSVVVDETLRFERHPDTIDGISLQIPETSKRRLLVEFETDHRCTTRVIDTAGMLAHRSFWNEHVRVHEIDLEPAPEINFTWKVTPQLLVACTAAGHWYNRSLYDALGERTADHEAGPLLDDPAALSEFDVFHLHWPEWFAGTDPDRTREVIANLRAAGIPILWTQHNRKPHYFSDARESYRIWCSEADGVIHHSRYGREVMEADYGYGDHTRHLVAPHGHWGQRLEPLRPAGGKAEAEESLGLSPAGLRLGIIGAPREEKNVQLVIDAVHACERDDVQLCVWSLAGEELPDDDRIVVAEQYELVDLEVYARRLFSLDALVMPYREPMLTTGVAADAIGAGIGSVVSDWGYLDEALGPAGIPYGSTVEDLAACIDSLSDDELHSAGAAATALQADTDWSTVAETTYNFIEGLVADH